MELWNKFWKDDKGHVVIWQMPNLPLIAWAVLTVISLLSNGRVSDVFGGVADIALAIWAGLEITKGVNYFRRLLGLIVLIYSAITFIKIFTAH